MEGTAASILIDDQMVTPQSTADFSFLRGGINLDQIITLDDALPWGCYVDGDDSVGIPEALFILQHLSGYR